MIFIAASLIVAETPTAGSILGGNENLFWNLTYLILGLYVAFRTVQIVRYFRGKSNKPSAAATRFAALAADLKAEQQAAKQPESKQ